MDYAFIIGGVYLIVFSFMLNTKNIRSALVFKVVPFMIGIFNLLYGLKGLGII